MPVQQQDFSAGDVLTSDFVDRLQHFHQGTSWNCNLAIAGTSVQIPAAAGNRAACINIAGKMCFNEATATVSFVGASSGTYYLYAQSTADLTAPAFTLVRALSADPAPAAAYSRQVGQVVWNGTNLTALRSNFINQTHGHNHALAGSDPLPTDSVGADQLQNSAVTALKMGTTPWSSFYTLKGVPFNVGTVAVAWNGPDSVREEQGGTFYAGANPTRWTVPSGLGGIYTIAIGTLFPAPITYYTVINLELFKNGAVQFLRRVTLNTEPTQFSQHCLQLPMVLKLSAGDYLEVDISIAGGTDSQDVQVFFEAARLGA